MLEMDVLQDPPALRPSMASNGRPYRHAKILATLHTQPLGVLDVDLPPDGLMAEELSAILKQELCIEIAGHLRRDGLDLGDRPAPTGAGDAGVPACLERRVRVAATGPLVSVVIPTRDRIASLDRCLDALASLDYVRYEVVVVDNAPANDATADLVRRRARAWPRLRYVREDHPGPARARNRGLACSQGDIVAFVDDDIACPRGWLSSLVAGFDVGERVACVTGPILPRELETAAQIWLEQFGGFSKGFSPRIYDLQEHRPPDILFPYTAGKFGSGANMAFRASILRSLGGFDPALGPATPTRSAEDIDLFFQVIASGYQLVYQPEALVRHTHSRDYARLRKQIHAYGVGLAAFLTKCLWEDPSRVFDVCRRLPAGLWYALSPTSSKNQKKTAAYPRALTRTELAGMAYGPIAYALSRWRTSNAPRLVAKHDEQ